MNLQAERNGSSARSLFAQRRTASSSQSHSFKAPASRPMQRRSPRPACIKLQTIRSAASLRMNRHTGMWEVALPLAGNHPRTTTMNTHICQSDTNMYRCTLVAHLCILEQSRRNTEGDVVCLENMQHTSRVEAHVARSPSNLTLRV